MKRLRRGYQERPLASPQQSAPMAGTRPHPMAVCPPWGRSGVAKPQLSPGTPSCKQRSRRLRASEATGMQPAPVSRGGADDEYTSTASHRSPSSHPRAAGMVGCMTSSGCPRRAAEQQQRQRELEGARSLPSQSSSRMRLNSRNAQEHQVAAAEQPAATPRSRRGKKSFQKCVPRKETKV